MKTTDIVGQFIQKACSAPRRIVFPEGRDEKIVAAATAATAQGITQATILGKPTDVTALAAKLNVNLDGVTICDPSQSPDLGRYAAAYTAKRPDVSEKLAARLVKKDLMFAAIMVATGDADGMVAGVANATSMVLQSAGLAIGYAPGISAPSSIFIMVLPEIAGRDDSILVFADPAVNISPSAQELAEIAVVSGRNTRALLGVEPNVALLSFSTKGSASHPDVDKVVQATALAQKMAPELNIDGELQADAAIVERVAQKKVKQSNVAGKANVLIFPDLNAGNIAYKLTQYLANAKAVGPFLQGFARPVSDLSRGASVEDIVGVTAVTVVQAQAVK